jgi:hypothetical protein
MKSIIVYLTLALIAMTSNSLASNKNPNADASSLLGLWSSFVTEDPVYGRSIVHYDFLKNGRLNIIIAGIPDSKPAESLPIRAQIIKATYNIKDDVLSVSEGGATVSFKYSIQEDILLLRMNERFMIFMKSRIEGEAPYVP